MATDSSLKPIAARADAPPAEAYSPIPFAYRAPYRTHLPERSLDVLRATAVLMVLVHHALSFKGWEVPIIGTWIIGRAGVLIFFVHTSLVLMSSIERGGVHPGWVRRFYLRRAFRIYPLAIAVVVLAILIGIPPHALPPGLPNVLPALTSRVIVGNLALIQNLIGVDPVQGVLWSLPLEIQMYVALPLCYLVAIRGPWHVVGLIALACLGSVAVYLVPQLWRAGVLSFAPVFLCGVLAYAALRRWPQTWDLGGPWLTRPAHTIATYSYGIYLLHMPALWLAFRVLHAPVVVQWVVCTVLLVLLPWLAYRLIEHPMIRAGARLAHSRERAVIQTAAP